MASVPPSDPALAALVEELAQDVAFTLECEGHAHPGRRDVVSGRIREALRRAVQQALDTRLGTRAGVLEPAPAALPDPIEPHQAPVPPTMRVVSCVDGVTVCEASDGKRYAGIDWGVSGPEEPADSEG